MHVYAWLFVCIRVFGLISINGIFHLELLRWEMCRPMRNFIIIWLRIVPIVYFVSRSRSKMLIMIMTCMYACVSVLCSYVICTSYTHTCICTAIDMSAYVYSSSNDAQEDKNPNAYRWLSIRLLQLHESKVSLSLTEKKTAFKIQSRRSLRIPKIAVSVVIADAMTITSLQWRHNGRDSVSNNQTHWPLCWDFTGPRWIPHKNDQ